MSVYSADAIRTALPVHEHLLDLLASSFVALSTGQIVLGPVSHFDFAGVEGTHTA